MLRGSPLNGHDNTRSFSLVAVDHEIEVQAGFKLLIDRYINSLSRQTKGLRNRIFYDCVDVYIVGRNGIKVDPSKVDILQTWPKPRILSEARSFIKLLQFFPRIINDFSTLAAPLTNLTKKGIGIRKWDEQCDKSFQSLKSTITTSPILVAPD